MVTIYCILAAFTIALGWMLWQYEILFSKIERLERESIEKNKSIYWCTTHIDDLEKKIRQWMKSE